MVTVGGMFGYQALPSRLLSLHPHHCHIFISGFMISSSYITLAVSLTYMLLSESYLERSEELPRHGYLIRGYHKFLTRQDRTIL